MRLAADRLRDEIAAHQPQHIAVAGVSARSPEAVAARNRPDDRHQVRHEPEDARPAVRDLGPAPEQLLDEVLERALDPLGRRLGRRELGVHVDVAEPADEEAPLLVLVPVVEPVTAVVRQREQTLGQRLGREHLAASRDDQAFELAE